MLKDFKEFAFKGNLIDMAVGIIIGGAFGTVVKSLVDNVFMPPLGALLAGIDFKKLSIELKQGVAATDATEAIPAVMLNYGQFITDFISFILLALAVFIVIKKVIGAMKKEEAAPEPEAPKLSKEEELLTEIRDLLSKKA
ncbi:MAG: large-conductance mechanosensitive channel protein MscL [Akkermansiaceae bacterium]|nr:large-conductance mechanosensitive channel protein MscL [Akkermansiaceae bacterium]MDP4646463.1 large-conductance mechanosensitive channel protein MscL [Akkermansiaceae bacterium]MDP4720509.1 large-conductance mechanosensitive channel protein MscL [Akkermansiaceae bacterium]MDP4780071.1 large-conductance mechanosensitive channel protein MscL [Akkermansiaceae bacterium]MDP4847664.1 large-conductance mechanosensitive channel protein MscL [Akkermansiaceae bacterium]